MAFRVCCSCGKPGAFPARFARPCRITAFLGNVIGSESFFWDTAYNALGIGLATQSQFYGAGSNTPVGPGQYLFEGVRYETYAPTEEGQQWSPYGYNRFALTGFPSGWGDDLTGVQYAGMSFNNINDNVGGPASYLKNLPGGNVAIPACAVLPAKSHFSTAKITSLLIPVHPLPFSEIFQVRYFRLLYNGVPVTGIRDAIDVTNAYDLQSLAIVGESDTADWTAVGVSSPLYANLDETSPPYNTDYIWSTADTDTQYTAHLATANPTGSEGQWTVSARVFKVDSAGTMSSGGNIVSVVLRLLCDETTIASRTSVVLTGTGIQVINLQPTFEEMQAVTDWSQLRVRVSVTVSGVSTARGCAITTLATTYDPNIRGLNLPFNGRLFREQLTGNFKTVFTAREWALKTPFQFAIRRGVRIGLDIWLQVVHTTSKACKVTTGTETEIVDYGSSQWNYSTTSPPQGANAVMAHGDIGFGCYTLKGFDTTKHTYKVTANGGFLRPAFFDTDSYTFTESEVDATGTFSKTSGSGLTLSRLELNTVQEIPFIMLMINASSYKIYVPPDNAGFIRHLNNTLPRQDSANPIQTKYYYQQTPGGTWNCEGSETFVPLYHVVNNNTGTFTDDTSFPADWPQSITVERVAMP